MGQYLAISIATNASIKKSDFTRTKLSSQMLGDLMSEQNVIKQMRNKTMKIFNSFIIITMLAVPVAADTVNSRFEVAARYAREKMLEERNAHDSTSNCCSDSNCCSNSNCCCSTSESTSEPTPDKNYDNDGSKSSYHSHGSSSRGWAR